MRIALVLAAVAISVPALAFEASPPAAPKKEERKICKMTIISGSNLRKRVCHTRAEWRQLADNASADDGEALEMRTKAQVEGGASGMSANPN